MKRNTSGSAANTRKFDGKQHVRERALFEWLGRSDWTPRPEGERWLNDSQTVVVCLDSDTPRGRRVREAVHQAMRLVARGELRPVDPFSKSVANEPGLPGGCQNPQHKATMIFLLVGLGGFQPTRYAEDVNPNDHDYLEVARTESEFDAIRSVWTEIQELLGDRKLIEHSKHINSLKWDDKALEMSVA